MTGIGGSRGEARRANAEILFIALLTASIVAIGAAGVTFATDSASDTSEQMDQPDFEHDGLDIVYVEGPILSQAGEPERIRVLDGDESITAYNNNQSASWEFAPGDILFTSGELSTLGIDDDSTIEIVWDRKNGESEVVEEIYIPDEEATGSSYSTGNQSVDLNDTDMSGGVLP